MASLDSLVLWLGSSGLSTALLGRSGSLGRLLLAMMELVADAIVRHARADNILKPIVVTLNLQCVCNYGFDPIIVAHHLNLVNNAVLTGTSAR